MNLNLIDAIAVLQMGCITAKDQELRLLATKGTYEHVKKIRKQYEIDCLTQRIEELKNDNQHN